ncbi:hypothetical protein [uncultured Novosphingobium sp.]|uniref:hypothetical protein n=1 Tax=uncultured Novosphingobium sp. TaxID=292277 RepID=UPI002596897E|nr:hypothetical protein [uncultured Novosphingobium sp.]
MKASFPRVGEAFGKDQFHHRTAIFQRTAFPEIPRVCEELHRGLKNLVIVLRRCAAFGDVFRQNQLVMFQLTDLAFIRADDRCVVRFHDPVEQLADFLFHRSRFQLEGRTAFLHAL